MRTDDEISFPEPGRGPVDWLEAAVVDREHRLSQPPAGANDFSVPTSMVVRGPSGDTAPTTFAGRRTPGLVAVHRVVDALGRQPHARLLGELAAWCPADLLGTPPQLELGYDALAQRPLSMNDEIDLGVSRIRLSPTQSRHGASAHCELPAGAHTSGGEPDEVDVLGAALAQLWPALRGQQFALT
jgi:hypothetical protein